jgi:O-antigen ligase
LLSAPPDKRSSMALTPGMSSAPLGPFAAAFASIYLTIAFVIAAPAVSLEPFVWTLALGLPIGALLLAPRDQVRRVVLDGPLLLLIAWIALSILWSYNKEFGTFLVRRDIPLWITASLMASLLPKEQAIAAIRRGLTIAITINIGALIFVPATRLHASDGIYLDDYPGWHGYFIHKNVFAPYLIFALVFVLMFERDALRRAISLGVISVLLVGSNSATGVSAALFVGALYWWFRFFHRGEGRRSTAFVVSSMSVGIIGLMGAAASLSTLTSAYGKDLTFSGRTYIWSGVINAIEERPLTGYGIAGVFRDINSEITRSIWRDVGFHIPHAHSGTLDIWLSYGLIGVALFGLVLVSSFAKGIRLVRVSPQMGEWILILVAAQFLMSLSENVFLGEWIVYMGVVRALVQREINENARRDVVHENRTAVRPGGLLSSR